MRIVVVEDEIRTRLGLYDMIPSLNEDYSVDSIAENGYEGLKMILELRSEIVVTDIKMPRMNGLKMIEKVIESRVYPSFIILSGFKDFEYAKQGILLGVKEYLLKPITINELRKTLNRIYNQLHREKSDENNEQQFSYYIEKMMKKIHKNYAYQLCLTDFTNDFSVTPEYLSNLFSKETGYTFSAYLRHYRI